MTWSFIVDFRTESVTYCPQEETATEIRKLQHELTLRVRYSETDQMGTFYNSRALEWFECGRTELLRAAGLPYARMEQKGALLPLVEAHVNYHGRARYDDELKLIVTAEMAGKARVRFDVAIAHASSGAAVASGYTVHAVVDASGRPIRPPEWLVAALNGKPGPACPYCNGGACIGACGEGSVNAGSKPAKVSTEIEWPKL